MLERKKYHAVDMVISIACGFNDSVTGYTETLELTRVHAIHTLMMSMMSSVTSSSFRQD